MSVGQVVVLLFLFSSAIASEFLYIDPAHIYHMPSFSPATSCQVPPHPIPGLYGAVAGLVDGSLVICGGRDKDRNYQFAQSNCHTLRTNGWTESASLRDTARWAAASSDGDIMVVTGGRRSSSDVLVLVTTQTYKEGTFSRGLDMPQKLYAHCQVTSNRGEILVTGGVQSDGRSTSASMYKMVNTTWSTMPPMQTARYGHACVIHHGYLYTMGGKSTSTVEMFNFLTNQWGAAAPLPGGVETWGGHAVTYRDTLFYIGSDGQVMKMAGNTWVKVEDIAGWGYGDRHLAPAPVVTRDVLKC